jgi:hypothetical protein
MIKFVLVIEEEDKDGNVGDRILSREFEWHTLPRTGEDVCPNGTIFSVTDVCHRLRDNVIKVYVRAQGFDFTSIIDLPGYELTDYTPAQS